MPLIVSPAPTHGPRSSLNVLPNELLLDILLLVPDSRSLYHLILAAPNAARLFANNGPRILDAVLDRSVSRHDDLVVNQIAHAMRLVALVSSSPSSERLTSSWASFRETYIPGWQGSRELACSPAPLFSASLGGDGSKLSARQVLLLVRQVSFLAADCFDFFLGRWKQTRPQHLLNKQESYRHSPMPWRERFKGYYYEPSSGGLPTREELLRIQDGLWHLLLGFRLKNAAAERTLTWSDSDIRLLGEINICELFPSRQPRRWEAVASALYYVRQRNQRLESDQLRLPSIQVSGVTWSPVIGEEVGGSGAGFGCNMFRLLATHPVSPLYRAEFDPFRSLGIGIWSKARLLDFELGIGTVGSSRSPSGQRPDFSGVTADLFFTWRSLLGEEDIARVEARMEEQLRQERENVPVPVDNV